MSINEILAKFEQVKNIKGDGLRNARRTKTAPPALLSLKAKTIAFFCTVMLGCSVKSIIAAVGLKFGDLFPASKGKINRRIEVTYPYQDEIETLLSRP